ncbi:MAG: hypothetical protein V3U14_12855 [candidate division NC10 bacterium]
MAEDLEELLRRARESAGTPTTTTAPPPGPAPAPTSVPPNEHFGPAPTAPHPLDAGSEDERFEVQQNNHFSTVVPNALGSAENAALERGGSTLEGILSGETGQFDENNVQEFSDFVQSFRGDSEKAKDLVFLVQRLKAVDDEEVQETVAQIIARVGPLIDDELWLAAGIDPPADRSNFDIARGAALTGGMSALSTAMEFLDRPSQGVLAAAATIAQDGVNPGSLFSANQRLRRGLTFREQADLGELDQDGDEIINFREAVGADPDVGGRWVGALDTIAVAATDPTTYITLGSSTVAKGGLGAVGRLFGDDVALKVARRGLGVLNDEHQTLLRKFLIEQFEQGLDDGSRRKLREVVRRVDVGDVAEVRADRALGALEGGTGVVNFAGRQVPGSNIPRRAGEVLPGARKVALDDAPSARLFDDVASSAPLDPSAVSAAQAMANIALPKRGLAGVVTNTTDDLITVGSRGADDALEGFITYDRAANSIDIVHVAEGGRRSGLARRLVDKLEEVLPEGVSLEDAIRNSELTDDGRAFFEGLFETTSRVGPQVTVLREGIAQGLRNTDPVKTGAAAFSPRAGVRRTSGGEAARTLDTLRTIADGTSNTAVHDMIRRMGRLAVKSEREMGKIESQAFVRRALDIEELAGGVGPRLSQEDRVAQALAEATDAGNTKTAQYLETLAQVRGEIDAASVRAGLDVDALRQNYIPHILTKEGREAVTSRPGIARRVLGIDSTSSLNPQEQLFHQARTGQFADLSIDEINNRATAIFNLPKGTKLFEDDALTAFAVRGKVAHQAAARTELVSGLAKAVDRGGEPMALMGSSRGVLRQADELGYKSIETPLGTLHANDEVLKEVVRVGDILTDDKALAAFAKFRKEWSGVWATYATVPLIDGLGFHSRNATGNLMLNALAGVVNPKHYAEAFRAQRAMSSIRKNMAKTGDSFEESLGSVSTQQAKLLRSAREHGVLSQGFFDDLQYSGDIDNLRPRRVGRQTLPDNTVTRTGRAVGSAIENNARLTHYISMLDTTGSAADAAASVRKFLFDYSDLTAFERTNLRQINRFYTFMRKNTAVQMWAMANRPGRVNAIARAQQSLVGGEATAAQPGFDLQRGNVVTDLFGSRNPGIAASVGIDSPFKAAIDAVEPLSIMIEAIVPGGRDVTQDEFFESLANITSGPQAELYDLVFNREEDSPFDRTDKGSTEATLIQLADLVAPAYSQFDRFVGKLTGGEGVGFVGNEGPASWSEMDLSMVAANALLGLTVYPVSDRTATGVLYANIELLETALQEAKDRGMDVPTVSDLRRNTTLFDEIDALIESQNSEDDEAPTTPSARAQAEFDQISPDLQDPERQAEIEEMRADELRRGETADGTTRETRAADFAVSIGITNDAGEGRITNEVRIRWNEENPGDPFLAEDGTPLDHIDVEAQWSQPRATDVREWAISQGWALDPDTTYIPTDVQADYNTQNPDEQYFRSVQDRLESGMLPRVGVYSWTEDDGTKRTVGPDGEISP